NSSLRNGPRNEGKIQPYSERSRVNANYQPERDVNYPSRAQDISICRGASGQHKLLFPEGRNPAAFDPRPVEFFSGTARREGDPPTVFLRKSRQNPSRKICFFSQPPARPSMAMGFQPRRGGGR